MFRSWKRNEGTGQSRGALVLGPGPAQPGPSSHAQASGRSDTLGGQGDRLGLSLSPLVWDSHLLSVVHLHWSTRNLVAIAEDGGVRGNTHSAAYSSIGRRVSEFSYLPARQPIQPVSQPVNQSLGQVQFHGYRPQLERGPLVLLLIRLSRLFRHEDPLPPMGQAPCNLGGSASTDQPTPKRSSYLP